MRRFSLEALVLVAVFVILSYFFYQTVTLRARLAVLSERQAGIERDLARTEALLAATKAIEAVAPAAPAPCPAAVTPTERACPPRVRATLAAVEREFGLGHLDCRTLPGEPAR